MGLSGQQKKALCEAIQDAFKEEELKQVLMFELDKDYDGLVEDSNYKARVFSLVQHAARHNWIEPLITALRQANPGNPKLAAFASEYFVRADTTAARFDLYWRLVRSEHETPGAELAAPDAPPVFVEVDLDPDFGQNLAPTVELAGNSFGGLRRLFDLDPRHLNVTGRWILRGEPGSGKTLLLRHFAAQLAAAEDRARIPVFFSLPRLINESTPMCEQIEKAICRADSRARGLADELDRAGDEGRLVVLLDGFDEVGDPQQDAARILLETLRDSWRKSAIIVSSRPVEQAPPSGFRIVHLRPLDRPRKIALLAQLFGGTDPAVQSRAAEMLDRVEGDLGLLQLTGNPLNLTLLGLLVKDGQEPNRNRLKFYGQSIDRLLERRHRPHLLQLPRISVVRDALRHIALALVKRDRESIPFKDLEEILYELPTPQREALEQVPTWRDSLGECLHDIARRTGILAPERGMWESWRFLHPIFRDALAAEALDKELQMSPAVLEDGARDSRSRLAELAVIHGGQERQWAEVFALLIGGLPEPDTEVEALVRERPGLGLLTIATTHGLHVDTLEKILKLTPDWKQRRGVIERVFDLVGDPERAILLLDRLRETTRRGNDLYFIEETLLQGRARWPDLAGLVEQTLGRIYDHLEPPAPELFRSITVGDGIEVDYWCAVPPGSFSMGSHATPEERPVRQVRLEEGFRLAATPVTRLQYAAFDSQREGAWLADLPVVQVTWFEAVAFCRWLSRRGHGFRGARLPLEAEWEYACRYGGSDAPWWCETLDRLQAVAWYRDNSGLRCHPVGRREASPLGLYDLHGNVREWCWDVWTRDYQGQPSESTVFPRRPPPPVDPDAGRVLKGGCCRDDADALRSTARMTSRPYLQSELVGFRVLLPELVEAEAADEAAARKREPGGERP